MTATTIKAELARAQAEFEAALAAHEANEASEAKAAALDAAGSRLRLATTIRDLVASERRRSENMVAHAAAELAKTPKGRVAKARHRAAQARLAITERLLAE